MSHEEGAAADPAPAALFAAGGNSAPESEMPPKPESFEGIGILWLEPVRLTA